MSSHTTGGDVLRGAVAGMIGGAVASWVMNQFQELTTAPSPPRPRDQTPEGGEDATVKTAQAISHGLFEHELTGREKEVAGPAVHYAYGSLVGGLYGAAAEVWPVVTTGFATPYATALFLLGDEVAVPALRLGPPPTQTPPAKHADAFAAHLVYGIALDLVRRVARHVV